MYNRKVLFKYRPKKHVSQQYLTKRRTNFSLYYELRFFLLFCFFAAQRWSTFYKKKMCFARHEKRTLKDGCLKCIKNSRFLFTISFGCVPTRIAIICILKAHLKLCVCLYIITNISCPLLRQFRKKRMSYAYRVCEYNTMRQ